MRRLYERDLPGEFSLKNDFIKSAFKSFEQTLDNDLKFYFKNKDYNYDEDFYDKALDYYNTNKSDITYGNVDEYADEFVSSIKQSFTAKLARNIEAEDNRKSAAKTGMVNGKKVWHWEKEVDPDDGTYRMVKVDGVDADFNYDGVYESMSVTEAKHILNEAGYELIDEAVKLSDEELEEIGAI